MCINCNCTLIDCSGYLLKQIEDTKGVTRSRNSKKDRQCNGQRKKDRQCNGQRKKDRQCNGQKIPKGNQKP